MERYPPGHDQERASSMSPREDYVSARRLLSGAFVELWPSLVMFAGALLAKSFCLAAMVLAVHDFVASLHKAPTVWQAVVSQAVLQFAAGCISATLLEVVADRLQCIIGLRVSGRVFEHLLQGLPFAPFADTSAGTCGSTVGTVLVQAEKLQATVETLLATTLGLTQKACTLVGLWAAVWSKAPWLSSLGLVLLAPLVLWTACRQARVRRILRQEMHRDVQALDRFLHMLANLRDLRHLRLRQTALMEMEQWCNVMAHHGRQVVYLQAGTQMLLGTGAVSILAILMLCALARGASLSLTVTVFAGLLFSLEPMGQALRLLGGLHIRWLKLDDLVRLAGRGWRFLERQHLLPALDRIERLDVQNLSLDRNGQPVLEKVNLSIRTGEIVGIAGASGTGKTTLIRIILGLLDPTGGVVRVNGVPLSDINRLSYWQRVAYVSQRQGLEAGASCSTHDCDGRRCDLIVFDEPTGCATPEEEQDFAAAVKRGAEHRLTLLISHRPGTLALCDRVFWLVDRRLEHAASHPEQAIPSGAPATDADRKYAA